MIKCTYLTVVGILSAPFLLGDLPFADEPIEFEVADIAFFEHEPAQNRDEGCISEVRTQRITAKHRESNGIGYEDGYSTLEGFFSMAAASKIFLFADLRGHVFNNGKQAYNAGIGLRGLSESTSTVYGLNAFYDHSDGRHKPFNQVGVGFEILGRRWDLRANGYFPVSTAKKKYRDRFLKFKGNKAIFVKDYEFPFIGCELAFGKKLFKVKFWDMHAKLSGYWFNGKFGRNAGGGLFELSTNITRYVTLKGQVSYDTLFREIFQGEAAINVPFGGHYRGKDDVLSCKAMCELHERLAESVDRFEIIVTSTKRKKAVAIDPLTGEPLKFIFVNNTSHSLGTFESPFPTLLQAQQASAPGNVIYVFQGDGTSNGMSSGITLKNNQKLIGSAAPLTLTTSFGQRILPAQTVNTPFLINSSGNVVTLANNNQVSGFTVISAPTQTGIAGSGSIGAEMSYNLFLQSGTETSVVLTTFTGNLNVYQNTFAGGGVGLNFTATGDATGTINNNLFSSIGASGLTGACAYVGSGGSHVFRFDSNQFLPGSFSPSAQQSGIFGLSTMIGDATNATVYITNNVFANMTNGAGSGIVTESFNTAIAKVLIANNNINNTGGDGIQIVGTASSILVCDIERNVVSHANQQNASTNGIQIFSFYGTGNSITVRLIGNSSFAFVQPPLIGGFGYNFQSDGNPFYIQSSDGQISGVQALNIGSIATVPPFTFIPLFPLF